MSGGNAGAWCCVGGGGGVGGDMQGAGWGYWSNMGGSVGASHYVLTNLSFQRLHHQLKFSYLVAVLDMELNPSNILPVFYCVRLKDYT